MTTIRDIQLALNDRGYGVGIADGIWGRKSIAALRAFQASRGLSATGIIDAKTLAALFPMVRASAPQPVWYAEMLRFKGLREGAGASDNPTILGWAKALGGWVAQFYRKDSIAWCGLAVGHAIAVTLPNEALPANPLGALEYRKFGVPLKQGALGAVLVFSRKGGGHVALYSGEDADAYYCLGGNQADAVSIARIAKSRCVAIRWPATVALPIGGPVAMAGAGALSVNEA